MVVNPCLRGRARDLPASRCCRRPCSAGRRHADQPPRWRRWPRPSEFDGRHVRRLRRAAPRSSWPGTGKRRGRRRSGLHWTPGWASSALVASRRRGAVGARRAGADRRRAGPRPLAGRSGHRGAHRRRRSRCRSWPRSSGPSGWTGWPRLGAGGPAAAGRRPGVRHDRAGRAGDAALRGRRQDTGSARRLPRELRGGVSRVSPGSSSPRAASVRLGEPKQLLPYRGRDAARRDPGAGPPCASTSWSSPSAARPTEIRERVDLAGSTSSRTRRRTGCGSSIARRSQVVDPRADGLVLLLGDQPGVRPRDVRRVAARPPRSPSCRYSDGLGIRSGSAARSFPSWRGLHGDKAVWKLSQPAATRCRGARRRAGAARCGHLGGLRAPSLARARRGEGSR